MIQKRDGIDAHADYIYSSEDIRIATCHRHSKSFITMQDLSGFKWLSAGVSIRVDTLYGKHSINRIKRVVGNVIELIRPMDHLPLPGGIVKRIYGESQSWIDLRIRDYIEKHKLTILKNGRYLRV